MLHRTINLCGAHGSMKKVPPFLMDKRFAFQYNCVNIVTLGNKAIIPSMKFKENLAIS